MLPVYITKIHAVYFMDSGETVRLQTNDKNVWGYLGGIGYNQGYNSIYPNIEQMAYHLGIGVRTVSKSLSTLEKVGLIKRKRTKQKGRWDSTYYWVYRPNMVDRVQWLDVNENVLYGKHYRFNTSQFRRNKEEVKKSDKLLYGLLDLVEQEAIKEVMEDLKSEE